MDMYLGTDSTDTTPRFALGFGNYLDTINANYRRASQGLDGIGVDRDFDYYIYCGNEAWSDSVCANAPTWNSWSYYWGGNWGPYFYYWTALCPSFWEMPNLASVLQNVDEGKVDGTDMNAYFPTQTLYFMAACFGLSPAVSNPQATYNAIRPSDAVDYATKQNTWGAYTSTFNYVYAATAIFLQRSLGLPNPPSPKDNSNMSPASVASLTPIGNGTFTPPISGLPSTSGGAPNPTIWATPQTSISDTALDQAIAIHQIVGAAAAAAANSAPSTVSTAFSATGATSPMAAVTTAAPSLITTSYTTTYSPLCTFASLPAGGPLEYGADYQIMGHCQCGASSDDGYWAPSATVCTDACTSLSTLCGTNVIPTVITAA